MEEVILVEPPGGAPAAGDQAALVSSRSRTAARKTLSTDVGDTPGSWARSAKVIAMLRLD